MFIQTICSHAEYTQKKYIKLSNLGIEQEKKNLKTNNCFHHCSLDTEIQRRQHKESWNLYACTFKDAHLH